jgi:hypothetical protein
MAASGSWFSFTAARRSKLTDECVDIILGANNRALSPSKLSLRANRDSPLWAHIQARNPDHGQCHTIPAPSLLEFFAELGDSVLFAAMLQLLLAFPAGQNDLALPRPRITSQAAAACHRSREIDNFFRHDLLDAKVFTRVGQARRVAARMIR